MEYHRVTGYETLSDALVAAMKGAKGHQPWIIAGLNGHRYFVFHSQATVGAALGFCPLLSQEQKLFHNGTTGFVLIQQDIVAI